MRCPRSLQGLQSTDDRYDDDDNLKELSLSQLLINFNSNVDCYDLQGSGVVSMLIVLGIYHVRIEVLTVVKMLVMFFWIQSPCGLVLRYKRFGATYCLRHQP